MDRQEHRRTAAPGVSPRWAAEENVDVPDIRIPIPA